MSEAGTEPQRRARDCAVLFGGTGFIGSFFARFLVDGGHFERVYVVDRQPVAAIASRWRRAWLTDVPAIVFVEADVREPLAWTPPEPVALIGNFAAVHREPGHADAEYYATNLCGAEQICAWAVRVGCTHIVFTSSISPYGPAAAQRDEQSLPVPATAYGGSKLVAEHIHRTWQAGDPVRRLVIARPGVVFGPGEGGNVSRLVRAVLGRYFFYTGNRETRKAGIYVRELCAALWWALERQAATGEEVILFNATLHPAPALADYAFIDGRRGTDPRRVSAFGDPRIKGCLHLPGAYRS